MFFASGRSPHQASRLAGRRSGGWSLRRARLSQLQLRVPSVVECWTFTVRIEPQTGSGAALLACGLTCSLVSARPNQVADHAALSPDLTRGPTFRGVSAWSSGLPPVQAPPKAAPWEGAALANLSLITTPIRPDSQPISSAAIGNESGQSCCRLSDSDARRRHVHAHMAKDGKGLPGQEGRFWARRIFVGSRGALSGSTGFFPALAVCTWTSRLGRHPQKHPHWRPD